MELIDGIKVSEKIVYNFMDQICVKGECNISNHSLANLRKQDIHQQKENITI